ncbi:MAG: DUF4911 domain-containing protein [Deltaproteobacteria bacterium]|nr:DUF4911 domain-containing protein [Deltaproteobacteria bacterium]
MKANEMETTILSFHVERKEISYLRWVLESYDGMAFLKTLNPGLALIELEISPGCEAIVLQLLDSLRRDEHIKIDPVMP